MRKTILACALLFGWSAHAAIPQSQRDALIALYQSTGGSSWTNQSGWLGAVGTECTWNGVLCDEQGANVVGIELFENHLTGTLPAALGNLPALRDLQFWNNEITGPLPTQIGQLVNLEDFLAQNNRFTGRIPEEFGALKKLRNLSLDGSQLDGPLPAALGSMTALEGLTLSYNAITGTIPPSIANLTNLNDLDLSNNRLSGALPAALGSLPKIEYLVLADNQFSGSIPPQLGDAATLTNLYLSYNKLTGGIPPQLGKLQNLQQLYLGNNALGGTIPRELGDLRSLTYLDIEAAELTGTIPVELFNLSSLQELHLGENRLTGTIAPDIAKLTKLEALGLYANQFSGELPSALGSLSALRVLNLGANAFTGSIPRELSRLTNLTYFNVSTNQLGGSIPPELGQLTKLEYFILYDNRFEGSLPQELGNFTSLLIFDVGANRLTGIIPDSFRKFTKLQQFSIGTNAIGGSIPFWIGEWTKLESLFAGVNQLTGTIPEGVSSLAKLQYLDVGSNQLTGSLPDFTRLAGLVYLHVEYNQLSGPLPSSIGALTQLTDASFSDNGFTGPLPREIGKLTNVEYLTFARNSLEGAIPAEIGQLKKAYNISLGGNRLTGAIPREIGQLSAALQYLDLGYNALRGAIPPEIRNLTRLGKGNSDFSFNALFTSDADVRAFVNQKQYDGDFEATQTITPTNVRVTQVTDRSATLTWIPIRYYWDGGGYQVVVSTSPNGTPVTLATTTSKEVDTITVRNLSPTTHYYFTLTAITHPHDFQQNLLISDAAPVQEGTTGVRVLAPPEVVITDDPKGMVQVDGKAVLDDSFTVTNFGDVATSLQLVRGEDFFTIAPEQFSLAGGASQTVQIKSLPKPAGTYWGSVGVNGNGAVDLYVTVALLSTAKPAGTAVAQAVNTRIEVAGAPGSDSAGIAQFKNTGTAQLTGIAVSDQPWVIPATQPVTIDPGQIGSVNFQIKRSKRPATIEGALVANLSLVYVDGSSLGAINLRELATTPSGVSVSKVTIVDLTKPPVAPGSIPALPTGDVSFILSGLPTRGNTRSDVALLNGSSASAIDDLKLYFTSGTSTSIASLQALPGAHAVSFTNILSSVYSASNTAGTLQIRSRNWERVGVDAKVTQVTSSGTMSGGTPVFRSDRTTAANQKLYLTGLTRPGDLLIQETGGIATRVRIEFFDASGRASPASEQSVAANALVELRDVVPAGAVSAVLTNLTPSSAIVAYARINDQASGDNWSIVDWGTFYRYRRSEAVRIPFADGRSSTGGGKRRAANHATAPRAHTDVTIFNPNAFEARATVVVVDSVGRTAEREVNIRAGGTSILADVASNAGTSTAQVVVTPYKGELVVTARSAMNSGSGSVGTALPVLDAAAGLRVGQAQIFSGLEDSTSTTVNARTAATFRTSYGFAETSGKSVRVKATILIDETSPLVAAVTSRTFDLAPKQQIVLPELLRSFAGDQRDSQFGDLHDLRLEIEVMGGDGAVIPFVIVTDNGTGDSVFRLQ